MAKKKLSGYELYVREACSRMRQNGENPNYVDQLGRLGHEFKALPEEVKQQYKDRAKNGNSGYPRPAWPPTQQSTAQQSSQQQQQQATYGERKTKPNYFDGPSTSGNQGWGSDPNVKLNGSPNKGGGGRETKPDVHNKPVIKEEAARGQKRKEFEMDVYEGDHGEERGDNNGSQAGEESHEPPKKKPGFSIPNWKNIKNSTQPEADRYFDYDMVQKRSHCESIVNSHAQDLLDFPLYSFSCNVLCKYKENQGAKAKFVPLEIAIAKYTIKNGLQGEPFHALIDSGPPPSNHWGDTHDHMLATHKITVTKDGKYPPGCRNDYRRLYKEMMKYTKEGERTILVADRYDLEQVQSCIEWIYEQFAVTEELLQKPSTWTILPLVEFVAAAYNHVYCKFLKYPLPKFTLHYFLKVRLETSLWDYEVMFMCDYHKHDDHQSKWCARNCAIRAFKAIELTLDEIYQHYQHHLEIENSKPQPSTFNAPPPPTSSSSSFSTSRQSGPAGGANKPPPPPSTGGQATANTTVARPAPRRERAQQIQQPLHMPEDKPAPLIEDKARRDEIWRQQLEFARQQLPPTPYYQGYYEIPNLPIQVTAPADNNGDGANPQQGEKGFITVAIEPPPQQPPLAIKPDEEKLRELDPRLKRAAQAHGEQ